MAVPWNPFKVLVEITFWKPEVFWTMRAMFLPTNADKKCVQAADKLCHDAELAAAKSARRLVNKDGSVANGRRDAAPWGHTSDLFHTLITLRWRWHLLYLGGLFLFSWFFFSACWYLLIYFHGDFDHLEDEDWKPCVVNVWSFSSIFIFSVETQLTIGYGFRYPSADCVFGHLMVCIQAIVGAMLQCIVLSLCYAKLTRPAKRSQTVKFSKYCVVRPGDKINYLLFQVANMQKSALINVEVKAVVVEREFVTDEEVKLGSEQVIDLETSTGFLLWTPLVCHRILPGCSPLYGWTQESMKQSQLELIVTLSGTDSESGHTFQARTSYLPEEIRWGWDFDPKGFNQLRLCDTALASTGTE